MARRYTIEDVAKLWEDGKIATAHPNIDRYFFVKIEDLAHAEQCGFLTPEAVMQAYQAGNTEDTHSVNLARLLAGGQAWYGGNAAYHSVMTGHIPAKFAPTPEIAKAFHQNMLQGNTSAVEGMLGIPLELCQRESGPCPHIPHKYAEPRSGDQPGAGSNATSYLANQADWTRANPAPATAILEPLNNYNTYVPNLKDKHNNNVPSINAERPLRALDHILPRQISTEVLHDDYLLASWFLSDPRVIPNDIVDRMPHPKAHEDQIRAGHNILRVVQNWFSYNRVLNPYATPNLLTDKTIVRDLTDVQCKLNTSWEVDVASETVKRPGTEIWYTTPWLHTTSPMLQGYPGYDQLALSPRVYAARYQPLEYQIPVGNIQGEVIELDDDE